MLQARDVAGYAHDPDHRPVVREQRHLGRENPYPVAIGIDGLFLPVEDGLARGDDLLLVGVVLLGQFLGEEVEVRASHHIFYGGKAKEFQVWDVGEDEATLRVLDVDETVRQVVDERAQKVGVAFEFHRYRLIRGG